MIILAAAALPAAADDASERAALRSALDEVNSDRSSGPAVPTRDGFFGTGFYISTERAGQSVGGERFGERRAPLSTSPRPQDGQRLLSR
ncbi:MAG: hypothetical protein AAFT19_00285 [Pseudomonadota bacterium]